MSLYGKNRFKNITSEYVEESRIIPQKEVEMIIPDEITEGIDLEDCIEKEAIKESTYIDSLLEALNM